MNIVICMALTFQLSLLDDISRDVLKNYTHCYNMSKLGLNILELRVDGRAFDKGKMIAKVKGVSIISNDGKRKTTTKFSDAIITYLESPPTFRKFIGTNEVVLSQGETNDLVRENYLIKLKSPSAILKMKKTYLLYCGCNKVDKNQIAIILLSDDHLPTKLVFDRQAKILIGMEYKKLPDEGDNIRVTEVFSNYKKVSGLYLPVERSVLFTDGLSYFYTISESKLHGPSKSKSIFSKP